MAKQDRFVWQNMAVLCGKTWPFSMAKQGRFTTIQDMTVLYGKTWPFSMAKRPFCTAKQGRFVWVFHCPFRIPMFWILLLSFCPFSDSVMAFWTSFSFLEIFTSFFSCILSDLDFSGLLFFRTESCYLRFWFVLLKKYRRGCDLHVFFTGCLHTGIIMLRNRKIKRSSTAVSALFDVSMTGFESPAHRTFGPGPKKTVYNINFSTSVYYHSGAKSPAIDLVKLQSDEFLPTSCCYFFNFLLFLGSMALAALVLFFVFHLLASVTGSISDDVWPAGMGRDAAGWIPVGMCRADCLDGVRVFSVKFGLGFPLFLILIPGFYCSLDGFSESRVECVAMPWTNACR